MPPLQPFWGSSPNLGKILAKLIFAKGSSPEKCSNMKCDLISLFFLGF